MATFPDLEPTIASMKTVEYRVKRVQFGNGYYQIAGDGINNNMEEWSVQWEALSATDKETIIAFLEARGGYDNFTWTAPDSSATAKSYICPGYELYGLGGNRYTISATFQEWPGLT